MSTTLLPDFYVFPHNNANEPSMDKAAWALELVRASGLCRDQAELSPALARAVFRQDIFEQADRLHGAFSTGPVPAQPPDHPASPTGTPPAPQGNLAVAPLIANQRCYGEVPLRSP